MKSEQNRFSEELTISHGPPCISGKTTGISMHAPTTWYIALDKLKTQDQIEMVTTSQLGRLPNMTEFWSTTRTVAKKVPIKRP